MRKRGFGKGQHAEHGPGDAPQFDLACGIDHGRMAADGQERPDTRDIHEGDPAEVNDQRRLMGLHRLDGAVFQVLNVGEVDLSGRPAYDAATLGCFIATIEVHLRAPEANRSAVDGCCSDGVDGRLPGNSGLQKWNGERDYLA